MRPQSANGSRVEEEAIPHTIGGRGTPRVGAHVCQDCTELPRFSLFEIAGYPQKDKVQ